MRERMWVAYAFMTPVAIPTSPGPTELVIDVTFEGRPKPTPSPTTARPRTISESDTSAAPQAVINEPRVSKVLPKSCARRLPIRVPERPTSQAPTENITGRTAMTSDVSLVP